MLGDNPTIPFSEGFSISSFYTIRVTKAIHRSDKGGCTDYSKTNSYGDCIQRQMEKNFLHYLGCYPPWFRAVDDKEQENPICNSPFNATKEGESYLRDLIMKSVFRSYIDYENDHCTPPCSQLLYDVRLSGESRREKELGHWIGFRFPKIISVKVNNLNVPSFFCILSQN